MHEFHDGKTTTKQRVICEATSLTLNFNNPLKYSPTIFERRVFSETTAVRLSGHDFRMPVRKMETRDLV